MERAMNLCRSNREFGIPQFVKPFDGGFLTAAVAVDAVDVAAASLP